MRFLLSTVVLLICLNAVQTLGQDVVSIYFKSGQSKMADNQLPTLNSISTNYDLSELDSIHYIGMADSTGSLKANLKLSEKRARNVAKYCEKLLPKDLPIQIMALGENSKQNKAGSRRVEVTMFFKTAITEEPNETTSSASAPISTSDQTPASVPLCYNIDYKLLHRSHLRTITKGKNEYALIMCPKDELEERKEHFYGTTLKNGTFSVKPVKWRLKSTGNFWWDKKRYVAKIPTKNYKTYKIFKTDSLPCNSCSQDFANKNTIDNIADCFQVDRFLMKNIQLKSKFFNSS